MAGTTVTLSAQDKGPGGQVTSPVFVHPLADQATGNDVLVSFDAPDDPYNPLNWHFKKKVLTTVLYGLATCWITFASAVYTAALVEISHEFHVSLEVSTLGISLFVLGFAVGPMVFSPLSEVYGRKFVVLIPYFISAVFSFGTAAAKDIQTVLITRFFAGLFGSAPVTVTGGALTDIWLPHQRGNAVVGYSLTLIGGPTIGPIVGGAFVASGKGWRWTEYITGIVMLSQFFINLLLVDESHAESLLVRKARRLRYQGNWALHAKHEEWDVSVKELARKYLVRPFQMMSEPICLLVSVYGAFVYGLLYASLCGYEVVYQEIRHWGPVTGNLPFVALFIGMVAAGGVNILNNQYYSRRFRANNSRAVPEARLPSMMLGSVVYAGALFLFGWTSSPKINFWPSIIAVVLTGFGFTTIFQATINYIIDTYTRFAASGIATATFLRSIFACAFPLFIRPMYYNIGVAWGTTVFACVAALLIPVPFFFFVYGRRIRAKGEWSQYSV
ncbi:to MSF membrane transporter [Aspergillus sclerotialis]|uniref:To MSF membrane transporter n=1 Tax=Aspergillus sclerotialis TaxID=2070753 RepID=A0A3A2ZKE1_9EURO|nr:to MSF membrane transporter [Aspergillus sclerotialis]